jgi:hypothetical protein
MRKRKTLHLSPLLSEITKIKLDAFIEPIGEGPVFFCWHSTTPKPMCELCDAEYQHGIVAAAEKAGIDPAQLLELVGIDDPLGSLNTTN